MMVCLDVIMSFQGLLKIPSTLIGQYWSVANWEVFSSKIE
jgi:hypothetical protein